MKKYLVIVQKWDSDRRKVVNEIAGEFTQYFLAHLFKTAYDSHFATNAIIKEIDPDKIAE